MSYSIEKIVEQHNGKTITVNWYHDEDASEPWKEDEGHGPVSEWTSRDKRPGERVLVTDRGASRYYDFQAAVKQAKSEGWDAPPYHVGTNGDRAQRAVEADFEYLRRWYNDEWHWCYSVVKVSDSSYEEVCGGYSSDDIEEITQELIGAAKGYIEQEARDSFAAACADIATVPARIYNEAIPFCCQGVSL
jgi:hypothetical protein